MKPLMILFVKNNKGSAFVQVLAAIAFAGVLLYWISPRVIKHREQVTKTAAIITSRLAMHSMLDYTLLGIKQRWCFSEGWMPESCGTTTATILQHPRSVERILMKGDTVGFLTTMGIQSASTIPLTSFEETIKVNNFTSLHPLYRILSDLKNTKVSAIKVSIQRATKSVVPEYGREVYLQVTVQLLDENSKLLQVGGSYLEAKSFVGVYPREVGSFALIVPGDLHLESTNTSSSTKGDLYIQNFPSRAAYLANNYGRIIFDSPVFVNGDVILPKGADMTAKDTVFTPVIFKEKVIMGNGSVMRNGEPFRPLAATSEEQFWSKVTEFGGFLKGIDSDGVTDAGLNVLSGKGTATATDSSLMQMCINRTLAMNDLSKTNTAKLYGELQDQSTKTFTYRLGLDLMDRFTRQRGQMQSPVANDSSLIVSSKTKVVGTNGAIASYELKFGDLKVTGDIPDNGSVVIAPKIDLTSLINSLTSQINSLKDSMYSYSSDIDDYNSKIKSLKKKIADAYSDIAAENGKSNPSQYVVDGLNSDIKNWTKKIQDYQDSIDALQTKYNNAQTQMANLQTQLSNAKNNSSIQPTVTLTVDVPNPDAGSNPSFKDFHIKFENGDLLVDSMGNPLSVKVYVQAYDVGYDEGNLIRANNSNQKIDGWVTFNRNGSSFVASSTLNDSSGKSKGSLPSGDINYDIDAVCADLGTSSSNSFGAVDWSTSFAANSFHSWSFTNTYAERAAYVFNDKNASITNKTATFVVKSIASTCTIEDSAELVTGFLTCENLVIKARTKALRIIGSIMVTQKMTIDPEAIKAGIRWSTIYNPMATFELRSAGVLTAQDGTSCENINRFPVWHPVPSIVDVANLYRCNAISLRAKADPFRWTSVDPDCGLVAKSNSTKCKNRMVNFYVLEVSREAGI